MKKTQEEYETMAMLLGMEYSKPLHCFIKATVDGEVDWFDAGTMQPLSTPEKFERIRAWSGEAPPPHNPSTEVLTWEGKRI